MLAGLNMLIKISYVDDTEIFKTCLDYWQLFVADIFGSCTSHALPGELPSTGPACSRRVDFFEQAYGQPCQQHC